MNNTTVNQVKELAINAETTKTAETKTAETATETKTAETKKATETKKKVKTVKEIKEALENNECVTLDEIAKLFRDLKFSYKLAKCEADNSIYIVNNREKVYLSFNVSKKNITVFSRKDSRHLTIFNDIVGSNEKRKKAILSFSDFYKFVQTVTVAE